MKALKGLIPIFLVASVLTFIVTENEGCNGLITAIKLIAFAGLLLFL